MSKSKPSIAVFDTTPIELDGFTLSARRVVPVGKPSLQQWAVAIEFVQAVDESGSFWLGELWNYGEGRDDWREQLPQVLADLGLDYKMQTFYNYGHTARRVTGKARETAPSMGHARIVEDLDEEDQIALLTEARDEQLTVGELKRRKRERKRRPVAEGQADLAGRFRVIYADPPWTYNNSGVITETDAYGRAARHYPGMTVDELIAMGVQVQAHSTKNAVLFVWVTAPMLYYATDPDLGPDPFRVVAAWGFEPKTGAVWDKVKHNFGHYFSIRHEHLLVATRGSCAPDRQVPMQDSVVTERRSDVHSEKPEIFRTIIEHLYDGPYVELFARSKRKGWTTWGNQINGALIERAG